ncbi:MAG: response regulator transcription factor [Endomicrobiaceae bacterium]|jgi:two-component system phosphate regulon response regulator PhoB/two-component system alkaline phosphatase synthesis response regulator PhoP|nr:response regulator transcription factor [Endomicrobiaceae bacterium]MDD3730106.1 response regulator transcription factor [Endomicrobiaceae bacterium]MDD4165969.1 response regulator transcription factor [Endomicrobiaceae bacterium]
MTKLISIVDDEEDILEALSVFLKKNGYDVITAPNAADFFKQLKKKTPDLFILDLMLPDMDGYDICKKLKNDPKYSSIPVIMLSAKSEESDKIIGLELGADDYVTKPFSQKELLARIKVIHRRNILKTDMTSAELFDGKIKLSKENFELIIDNKKITLTTTEFKLLELLISKKGNVLSRDKILDYIWGEDKIVIDRTVDVHIRHLRKKLGKYGDAIKNIHGVGYKIED